MNDVQGTRSNVQPSLQHLAVDRTHLAIERTRLAIQRTVLAYVTALIGVLAFGLVVWQYEQFNNSNKITFVVITAIISIAIAAVGIAQITFSVRSLSRFKTQLEANEKG